MYTVRGGEYYLRFLKVTLLLLFLFNSFGGFVNTAHAALGEPPSGSINMASGLVFNIGTSINESISTTTVLTDGSTTESMRLYASQYAWVDIPPTKLVGFRYHGSSYGYGVSIHFYNSKGEEVHFIKPTTSTWRNLFTFVADDVVKVALKNVYNTNGIYSVLLHEVEFYKGDDVPPAEVTGLKTSYLAGAKAHVSWTNPSDTDFKEVQIFRGDELVAIIPSPGNSHTFEAVTEDVPYRFHTVDTSANRSAGVAYVVRPPPDMPVVTLSADTVSHDRVILSFSGKNVDTYQLYRDGELLREMPNAFRSYSDFKVSPESDYTYELKGINVSGEASSVLSVRTAAAPPPKPPDPPPDPMPTPPPSTGLPLPEPDTGNEDLDEKLVDLGGALEAIKNGALIIIFWAIVIAISIFGARWLWQRFKIWMHFGSVKEYRKEMKRTGQADDSGFLYPLKKAAQSSSGKKGGSGGGKRKGGSGRSGSSSGSSGGYRTYTHNGKEYKVYEGSADSRNKLNNALKKF